MECFYKRKSADGVQRDVLFFPARDCLVVYNSGRGYYGFGLNAVEGHETLRKLVRGEEGTGYQRVVPANPGRFERAAEACFKAGWQYRQMLDMNDICPLDVELRQDKKELLEKSVPHIPVDFQQLAQGLFREAGVELAGPENDVM